jgi:UDP-N-acetylglucosamine--N-acetylmuramyl-(pentapeptide) pyrophosphoryl-undecaprenol N-acetylglucosamine transferase
MGRIRALAVAGGGTGGHLFPGLAIAREFRRRDADVRILFVGVAGKMEEEVIPASGMEFLGLKVRGLKGMAAPGKLKGLFLAARAVMQCRSRLSSFRPELMVGVGGYSSGPAALAAWSMGIPLVLQEQNTVPGMTNRFLGRLARRIFLGFEEAAPFFPSGRTVVTGNPVRDDALGKERTAGEGPEMKVLVLGGSRGAQGLNRLVGSALPRIGDGGKDLIFIHQSGADDREWVEQAYGKSGLQAEVRAFIDAPGDAYGWADLVLSRSGAGAVSEIAANGKPAILVPFPHAAGGHQGKNAEWLARKGGAVIVEEKSAGAVERLAGILLELAGSRQRLREMAERSRKAGMRDAAARIVTECHELLNVQGG